MACKEQLKKVPEAKYPSVSKEDYENPEMFPKLKKTKSMQPRTLEEDTKRAEERIKKKYKKLEKQKMEEERKRKEESPKYEPPPHPYYYRGEKKAEETSSGLQEVLKELESPSGTPVRLVPIEEEVNTSSSLLWSPSDIDVDTPLAKRLAARLVCSQIWH